jgi:hypothetical protein
MMAYDKLKQSIGNLADVERDANGSTVVQPVDLARCAEATRRGFEAILRALEACDGHGHEHLIGDRSK